MLLNPRITLYEFVTILREGLQKKFPDQEIGCIAITSYDKIKIEIDETNLVDCEQFRHRAGGF